MGLKLRVYPTPDSDLRAFSVAPRTLQIWLRQDHISPSISLDECWEDLDTMLAAQPGANSRSFLTPADADWKYPTAADHGAHGLTSTTTELLFHVIQPVDRAQVEGYVAQHAATQTDELLLYLGRLRESCRVAMTRRYGVLMALWDK